MKSRLCRPSSNTSGSVVVQQPAAEDRGHARIRVGQRLAVAVDIEEAHRDGRQPVGAPDGEEHLLVVALANGVDRHRPDRLRLIRRQRLQRGAALVAHELPLAAVELLVASHLGCDQAVQRAAVAALAVDRHRRGDEHAAELVAALGDLLEHDRRTHRVDRGVALDRIHRLADADSGREVDDRIDTVHGAGDGVAVADIADLQLDLGVEIGRALAAGMHLRVEVVQRADGVALGQQRIAEMRPDEAGAAGDEDSHCAGCYRSASASSGSRTSSRA